MKTLLFPRAIVLPQTRWTSNWKSPAFCFRKKTSPAGEESDVSIEAKAAAASSLIREILAQPGAVCVTSSFQAECMVLVDLVTRERSDIPVLFLDTGYHFPETYAYRDEMTARMKLNLRNLVPKLTVIQQEREFGILYEGAPDRCCGMRKVEPLFAGLAPYDTWFTALRRDQSPTRANLQEVDTFRLPAGKELRKIR